MTHQGPGQGQGRDRRTQQRLGTVVVMVGAAAGALTSLGGPAYASHSTAAVVVAPDLHSSAPEAPLPTEQQEIEAFLTAGYTCSDAEQLAALWGSPSVGSAKALAGAKLLAGSGLPLPPSDAPLPTEQQEIEAFLTAGYTYSDAEQLAALWGSPSVGSAKALAGAKLLAGSGLPLPPSDAC